MKLISERFNDLALNFKAPKGFMFLVDTICFINTTGVAGGVVFILDRSIEDDVTDAIGQTGDFIGVFSTTIAGQMSALTNVNHKSKFLAITKFGTGGVDCWISIYGELVSASKTELILEWFRKGR